MKKSFLITAMILVAAVSMIIWFESSHNEAKPSNLKTGRSSITIYQATDLHYLSSKLTDGGSFFSQVVDDGDGKVMHYSEALVKAFLEQVAREKPDVLLLTGDLTLNGEKLSHQDLSSFLESVEAAGVEVLVIPGNHDLNNKMAVHYMKDSYERVETVNAKAFSQIYKAYGYAQAFSRDTNSLSYVYPLGDNLRLLAVDVNTDEAPGQLKAETLSWVRIQLEKAKSEGVRVLAMTHQNMLQHNALFSGGFVFEGSDALLSLFESYDVISNLSGHMHLQHIQTSDLAFTEIATSSLAITPNQFAVIKINDTDLEYQTKPVEVSEYAQRLGIKDANLLDFSTYSENYFKESSQRKLMSQIKQTPNTQAIAEYFSDLNTAYFGGRGDLYPDESELLSLPEIKGSFLSEYMRSIRLEPAVNHNHLSLIIKK